jgi:6,7-dimethyl-8-ribityllumazine synthase
MPTFEGDLTPPTGRFALVAARFNALAVEPLVAGALDAFRRHGVEADRVDLVRVPGSLELPLVVRRMAASGQYRAVVALGTVIRGDTDHYDVVVGESCGRLAQISLETGVPVLNAVLTVETLEQALHRAGGKAGNKGYDAAVAAIEMANLLPKLSG